MKMAKPRYALAGDMDECMVMIHSRNLRTLVLLGLEISQCSVGRCKEVPRYERLFKFNEPSVWIGFMGSPYKKRYNYYDVL